MRTERPNREGRADLASYAGLTAFALLILLPGAGSPSQLTRGDVYMYVLMNVMSLLERASPWVLYFNQKMDFSKPPLFHWLLAAALKGLDNPFLAFRLPAVLCTAASVLLTQALGRLLGLTRTRSALAGLLLLSCWGTFNYGRQPLLEAPLLLAMLAAFYGLIRACLDEEPLWLLLFGLGLGTSAMVKWGVGPLMLCLFACVYLTWTRQWRLLRRHPFYAAAALIAAAAAALPYPLYLLLNHREAFRQQLFAQLVTERFREPTGLWNYLARALLVNPLPWTPLLAAWVGSARKTPARLKPVLYSWLLATAAPALLIVSRSDRYAYPALPALALLAAASLEPQEHAWTLGSRACAWLLGAALILLSAAMGWLGLLYPALALLGVAAGLGAFLGLWRGGLKGALAAAACAALGLTLTLGVGYAAVGFNVIPEDVIVAIGSRDVARFDNSSDAASTGYLPLYLRRAVPILGSEDPLAPGLLVVSWSGLPLLEKTAAQNGLRWRLLKSWENYHTNPRAAGGKILRMLATRSLEPIAVTHCLVELLR